MTGNGNIALGGRFEAVASLQIQETASPVLVMQGKYLSLSTQPGSTGGLQRSPDLLAGEAAGCPTQKITVARSLSPEISSHVLRL